MECEPDTDLGSLLLGALITSAFRERMETRSGVETAMEAAEEEFADARRRLTQAQAKLQMAGG